MTVKFEIQVACKNPRCQEASPLEAMPDGLGGPSFPTRREAEDALLGIAQATPKEERDLYSLLYDLPASDTRPSAILQGCPHCSRIYLYSAEEIFIQMPQKPRTASVESVEL